jgi:hypothetical protein
MIANALKMAQLPVENRGLQHFTAAFLARTKPLGPDRTRVWFIGAGSVTVTMSEAAVHDWAEQHGGMQVALLGNLGHSAPDENGG